MPELTEERKKFITEIMFLRNDKALADRWGEASHRVINTVLYFLAARMWGIDLWDSNAVNKWYDENFKDLEEQWEEERKARQKEEHIASTEARRKANQERHRLIRQAKENGTYTQGMFDG